MEKDEKVPVGLGTQVGLGASLTAFLGALGAVVMGDRTSEALGLLASATVALVVVLWGRYSQAKQKQKSAGDVAYARATMRPATDAVVRDDATMALAAMVTEKRESLRTDDSAHALSGGDPNEVPESVDLEVGEL